MEDGLILKLYEIGAIKFGSFALKSGLQSPIYIDLRLLISYPLLLYEVASEIAGKVKTFEYDRIAGIPYAALPIATIVSQILSKPLIYARKEAKEYGTKKRIEGEYFSGEKVIVIDDIITSGASKFETIQPFEAAGLQVKNVVVLIDREQGGAAKLMEKGIRLTSVLSITHILTVLEKQGKVSTQAKAGVLNWLEANTL